MKLGELLKRYLLTGTKFDSSVLYLITKLEGGGWKKFSFKDHESLPGLETRRLK